MMSVVAGQSLIGSRHGCADNEITHAWQDATLPGGSPIIDLNAMLNRASDRQFSVPRIEFSIGQISAALFQIQGFDAVAIASGQAVFGPTQSRLMELGGLQFYPIVLMQQSH
ncbi:hypothetical protein KPG66_01880 [Mycetohabitans sp. B2]|uniref:hypothetical protein n=1 Tax=Mycetohabitans sp. B2 TaxID=2841274 RepID=UPI001F44748D|nr:hypothetical protein [Mycetohabitans sp. B2]MCF7694914.1 hypothetical protein [Mycetohabitans sp. B2]